MIVLIEIKAGIDPTDSAFITGPQEHWLEDESSITRLTHLNETLAENYWNPTSNILRLDDTGTESGSWTLDGSNILRLNS